MAWAGSLCLRTVVNTLRTLIYLGSCLLGYDLLHAARLVQVVRLAHLPSCLRSCCQGASALVEARLLLVVTRTDIRLLVGDLGLEAGSIRAEGQRRVVFRCKGGQERVIDLLSVFADVLSNSKVPVIVADAFKSRVLLRLLDDLLVSGVSLCLRNEHRAASLDLLLLDRIQVLEVVAWTGRVLHIEFWIAFLFAIEWLSVPHRLLHHLLGQIEVHGQTIVILTRPGRD